MRLPDGATHRKHERTRAAWCAALFECLETALAKFEGPAQWARQDLNTLVKMAAQRRQNFTAAQQEALSKWERQRKSNWATAALDKASCL